MTSVFEKTSHRMLTVLQCLVFDPTSALGTRNFDVLLDLALGNGSEVKPWMDETEERGASQQTATTRLLKKGDDKWFRSDGLEKG
jgi:hypothetical protein